MAIPIDQDHRVQNLATTVAMPGIKGAVQFSSETVMLEVRHHSAAFWTFHLTYSQPAFG
jgi:hypothetical protein